MRAWLLLWLVGCSYTAPTSLGTNDGPTDPPDTLPPPLPCEALSAECIGTTLRECRTIGLDPIDTECALCITAPTAHCETLVPAGGAVTPNDLKSDPLIGNITIAANATLDSETGEITGLRGPGTGIVNEIEFQIVGDVGVFRFRSLTINANLALRGDNAVALVANRRITVSAVIDARGDCSGNNAGPGGFDGGDPASDGQGPGAGNGGGGVHDDASGGSGGGFGTSGSSGASSDGQGATAPGPAYGDILVELVGGSGGGGGGSVTGGVGGGGGGAVQLVANDAVVFTGAGAINAGGCGAERNPAVHLSGGGGGGAGGAILLEADAIDLGNAVVLAVNGGGGGGGDVIGDSAQNGQLSRTAATGGAGTGNGNGTSGGRGGNGGAPADLDGTVGQSGSANENAGGGGGGVGRIRINTHTDTQLTGDCGLCSPNFADPNTTTSRGAATIVQ
jgi:hypothetical protein